jgi:hypothetical protein
MTIAGDVAVTTRATCQEKRKQSKQEKNRPSAASTAIDRLSVVKPFKALMCSVSTFVSKLGALVF